jgi:hypothetical protein
VNWFWQGLVVERIGVAVEVIILVWAITAWQGYRQKKDIPRFRQKPSCQARPAH